MNTNILNKNSEQGFVLMTGLILLAILMGLGAAAMFKTQVEIKVSASALDSAQAFEAAQSGLDYTYAYWSKDTYGQVEFTDLATDATAVAAVGSSPILIDVYAESLEAIIIDDSTTPITYARTPSEINTWVQSDPGVRVYNLTPVGLVETAANNWNVEPYAQVAIWATRFKPSDTDYPYYAHKNRADTCTKCVPIVYALGKAGGAYKLVREYGSVTNTIIKTYGAMTNAPKYNNDKDCKAKVASTKTSTTTPADPTAAPNPPALWPTSHLIDATQSPGGVALASNNGIDPFNKDKTWDTFHGTGTTLATSSRAIDMWVVTDPAKTADSTKYPDVAGDNMSKIWSTVVDDSVFSDASRTNLDYFSADNQLFPLNAYREAANRISGFPTEVINGYKVTQGTGLLKDGLTPEIRKLRSDNGGVGRAGTLQWAEWNANIQASRPMYGLLRLMLPMKKSGTVTVCGLSELQMATLVDPIVAGLESPKGKLIVYGGALIDFFYDANGNKIYEPKKGERLLKRGEAKAAKKVNVNSPLMFNPVMDAMTPRPAAAGVDAAGKAGADYLNINYYPEGSPSWDLLTDAFTFSGVDNSDGEMDLVWDVDNVGRKWSTFIKATSGAWGNVSGGFRDLMVQESPAVIRSTATKAAKSHLWSAANKNDMWNLLDYYIRTSSAASKNAWYHSSGATTGTDLDNIEKNYKQFYIDTPSDATEASASAADLYHAFLPSGYIHGWKRAMQVTGLAKIGTDGVDNIWNQDLIQDNSAADKSPFSGKREKEIFHVTGVGANARIDRNFGDLPAEMYAGGLVDMHHAVNISGVVYTPDMLEFEQKDKGTSDTLYGNAGDSSGKRAALQYINGIVISGGGMYMKDATGAKNARTVIAYDDTSIDNLPTNNDTIILKRKYWQELK